MTIGIKTSGVISSRARIAALLSCSALFAAAPIQAFAQQATQEDNSVVLGQVVVSGTATGTGIGGDDDAGTIVAKHTSVGGKAPVAILDTPASVSVITAREIQKRAASSVEEVLQYTAGVNTDFYGADQRFDYFKIRGFDAYGYRDGLTLGRPFGGFREDPFAYERVEVLKGGNSTTLGVSDPGGAVNYVTKMPKRGRFGEVFVTGGSHEHKEIGFDFGDNITQDDTVSYRLTGRIQDADDEYDYSRNDQRFIQGGVTWRPTDATDFTIVVDHVNKDGVAGSGGYPTGVGFSRSAYFGEPDYNYRGQERTTVSLFANHDFGNGLSFSANGRYADQHTDFGYAYIAATPTDGSTLASRYFFGSDVNARQLAGDANLKYETSFDQVESRTIVGITHNNQVSDSKSYWSLAPSIDWTNPVYTGAPSDVTLISASKQDLTTTGLYIQQDLTFFDKVIATVALRNDWIDIDQTNHFFGTTASADYSEFTKRFGLTYKFTPEIAAYASYAESAVPASALTYEVERGEQYELGVKYEPGAFPGLFSAAIFDLRKTNVTVTDPVTSLPSAIGEIRVRGLDLEAKAELPNNFSLTAAYSYLDAEITENGTGGFVGNRPAFVPEHMATIWLDYTLQGEGRRGDLTVGAGARYSSNAFWASDNSLGGTGSHVTVDAALDYEIVENTNLQVNVKNLFDEKYVSYGGFGADWYNTGRSVTATLKKTW